MWQGVEYTAASGGMEEAIKNYCKKETGEPLLFFLWEMYKNICWSSSARDHRDFQHEKRYDTNFNVISSASGKGLLPSAAALACAFHDFLENRMELINGLAVFFGNGHMAQSGFITLFAFFIFGNRVMTVAF